MQPMRLLEHLLQIAEERLLFVCILDLSPMLSLVLVNFGQDG